MTADGWTDWGDRYLGDDLPYAARTRAVALGLDPLFYEKYYFTPGDGPRPGSTEAADSGFRVFRTRYATIGVLICWDQWYPEAARLAKTCR